MSFTFSVVFSFSIKPTEQRDISTYLTMSRRTVLLSGLNWKKKKRTRENAICVAKAQFVLLLYKHCLSIFIFLY